MKKLIILSFLFFATLNSNAQQTFQGIATYQSLTDISGLKFEVPGMSDDQKSKIMEKMKKSFQKTFTLKFDKTQSLFEEEQKLDNPLNSTSFISGSEGKYFKDIKEGIEIEEQDLFDKEFLIVDKLTKWDWKLVDEFKKIGDYNCQKATVEIPVTKEEKESYEADLKKQQTAKTNFIVLEEPKPKLVTAWFTQDIPVNNGPRNYWGLPGLILEVNDGQKTTIVCSKVVINPKEQIVFKKPSNGKKVTRKQFDKISEDKMNSMKDENGTIQINVNR